MAVLVFLGAKCANPECQWLNKDGTIGCADLQVLQVDHVNGGGTKERQRMSYDSLYRKVLKNTTGDYQLLCANCNWIKKLAKGEIARQNHCKDRIVLREVECHLQ